MKKDAVLDAPASMRIQVATKAGPSVFLRSAGVVVANHDPRHDDAHRLIDVRFAGFYRADEISFPFPSTLVLHPEKQPEARSRVVARTTENAIADTSETVDLKRVPSCAAESACGQKAIAAAVEGKLRTAMGSGDGIEVSSVSKQESRVLVVSSAQFLANPFASTGPGKVAGALDDDVADDVVAKAYAQKYLVGTILAFKMTLDWMSSDVDLLESITRRCGP